MDSAYEPKYANSPFYSIQNFDKKWLSEAKQKREAKLRVKIFQIKILDAKLRFALFASDFWSVIFGQIKVDKNSSN